MHQFHKFTPAWNSACFRQFLCPSSGVYSLYTWLWYMSYRFEDSFWAGPGWNRVPSWSCSKAVLLLRCFRAGPGWSCSKPVYKPVWHIPVLSVQWINSWWWAEELPKTCRVSCWSKLGKLVHLVGFIINKFCRLRSMNCSTGTVLVLMLHVVRWRCMYVHTVKCKWSIDTNWLFWKQIAGKFLNRFEFVFKVMCSLICVQGYVFLNLLTRLFIVSSFYALKYVVTHSFW